MPGAQRLSTGRHAVNSPLCASRMLLLSSVAVHTLAGAVLIVLSMTRPLCLGALMAVAISHLLCRRHLNLSLAQSPVAVFWDGCGEDIAWRRRDGRACRGRLSNAVTHGHRLVVLNIRRQARRWPACSLLLPLDSMPADSHRRLRVAATVWHSGARKSRRNTTA